MRRFRDVLSVTEPARLHNLSYRAKMIVVDLHRCDVSPAEFVAVIDSYLIKRYEVEPSCDGNLFRGSLLAPAAGTAADTGLSFFMASFAADDNIQLMPIEEGAEELQNHAAEERREVDGSRREVE